MPLVMQSYGIGNGQANQNIETEIVGALNCMHDQQAVMVMNTEYIVRRLTPLECERLQGYEDGWTDIEGASDTARYKALGNSVAIPCVEFVMGGIAEQLRLEEE